MIRKRSAFLLYLLLLLSGCKEKSFSSSFVSNMLNQQFELIHTKIQTISNLNEVEYEDYNFSTKVFEQSLEKEQINISIQYPQSTSMKDLELQKRINILIKDAALSPYNELLKDNDITEGTQWNIKFSIEYATNSLISVKFEGHLYTMDSLGKGIYWVYACNIDMLECKRITMSNIFDNSFKNKLNGKCFKCIDTDTVEGESNALDEMINRYRDDFETSDDNFYFTKNKFIILLPINGYFRFAADYETLKDSMIKDNPIWEKIINN